MTTVQRILICCILLLLPMPAPAEMPKGPSFDCRKASTPLEKAICSDESLSGSDYTLAAMYKALQTGSQDKEQIKKEQVQWVKTERNACGADKKCLEAAYKRRNDAIKAKIESVTDLSIAGAYFIEESFEQNNPATGKYEPGTTGSCIEIDAPSGHLPWVTIGITTAGTSGHQCSLTANALWSGNIIEYRGKAEGAKQECVLRFTIKDGSIHVNDVGNVCKESHCGMNAYFDREFPLKNKADKICIEQQRGD